MVWRRSGNLFLVVGWDGGIYDPSAGDIPISSRGGYATIYEISEDVSAAFLPLPF